MRAAKSQQAPRSDSLAIASPIASLHPAVVLFLIAVVGSFLRLFDLDAKSLWIDEFRSLNHARNIHDVATFLQRTSDAHPPLYFLVLKGWLFLGDGEFHFRLLSALFGVLCIPATYFLGRQFFDTRASMWAAFLVSISPFLLLHDREVRMYPMLVLFSVLSICFYMKALRGNSIWDWVGFTVSMSIGAYTHYHTFLIFAAMWLFFIIRMKRYSRLLIPLTISSAIVLMLFSFWLPSFLGHLERQAVYIPPDLFPSIFGKWVLPLYLVFSYSLGQTVMPWNLMVVVPGALLFGALFFWGLRSIASSRESLLFFLLFLFLPMLLALWKSSAMPRYLVFLAPIFYLLVSKGLVDLPSGSARCIAGVLLPAVLITPLANYYAGHEFHILSHTDPAKEVGRYLRENVSARDVVVNLGGGSGRAVSYYWGGDTGQFLEVVEMDLPPAHVQERLDQLKEKMTGKIWVIVAFPALKPFSDTGIEWMNQHYRMILEKKFGRDADFVTKIRFFKKEFYEYRIRLYLYRAGNGTLSASM